MRQNQRSLGLGTDVIAEFPRRVRGQGHELHETLHADPPVRDGRGRRVRGQGHLRDGPDLAFKACLAGFRDLPDPFRDIAPTQRELELF